MKNPLTKRNRELAGPGDPFQELRDMQNRMQSLLSQTFGGGWLEPVTGTDWSPAVDITEEDGCFRIEADLPDVKKEDVDVTVENGILTLSGERKQEREETKKRYHRTERSWGRYERSFSLPDGVDANQVSAQFKNGVLMITLPKQEGVKEESRSVEIQD